MCFAGLAAIGGMVASVAKGVIGFAAAQADYNAQSQAWTQNYINSLAAGRDEMRQYQTRLLQEGEAFSQKEGFAAIDTAKKAATAEVTAAAQGVSGLSVGNLITDVMRQGLTNRTALAKNYKWTAQQIQTEAEAVPNRIQSRINSVPRPTAPNPLTFMVDALSGVVQAAG